MCYIIAFTPGKNLCSNYISHDCGHVTVVRVYRPIFACWVRATMHAVTNFMWEKPNT